MRPTRATGDRDRTRTVAACAVVFFGSAIGVGAMLFACGGTPNTSPFTQGNGNGPNGNGSDGSTGPGGPLGDGGAPIFNPVSDDSAAPGPIYTDGGCAGLQCQISATCTNDGGTTIVGKVMDPAGANPLYNVLAYVPMFDPTQPSKIPPGYGIEPITGGVTFPSGVSCDSCSYLYTGNPIAIGTSGTDGTFTITNAPNGTNIPVVIQVGKWRAHTTVATVAACAEADAGEIKFPSSATGSDPIDSIPQIAISMGGADSLECLPYRMGMDVSEFTSGASSTGHIHIFTGGGRGGGSSPPSSSANMWNSLTNSREVRRVALLLRRGGDDRRESAAPRAVRKRGGARVPVALPLRVAGRPARDGGERRVHRERGLGLEPRVLEQQRPRR